MSKKQVFRAAPVLLAAACAYTILVRLLIKSHGRDSLLARAIGGDRKGNVSLALYTSAMEQGLGDYLLPYLARKVHGEWRLGANASGIYRPMAPNPADKIGEVIGPKGKMINSITEETGASISIEDDGTVFVGASNGEAAQAAIDKINAIANPQLPKVGERFLGTVVKTTDFGAFVSLLPGRDGLVHISKLGRGKRINKVEDVVKVGDKLRVEIADIDNRGKISLVLVAEDETAEASTSQEAAPADVATADA